MNLKDRLDIYYTKQETVVHDSSWISLNGGSTITTPHGAVTLFAHHHDSDSFPITTAQLYLDDYCRIHHIEPLHLHECIFFDIETTSLTSGTGNYAFLLGMGYFANNVFTVEQLFMREYADEPALLYYFADRVNNYKAIVTFNGKTFDIPIIKTRFRINRIPGFPVSMPVIDLLKPARSIFKSIYASCSLKSLEELLLDVTRTDDIPGYLIPDVYFTYQQTGFDPRIINVIEHNRIDITSMVLLLVFFNTLYQMLHAKQFHQVPSNLYTNIAKHLYSRNIQLFVELVEYAGFALLHNEHSLFKKYSTALKRLGYTDRALAFWEKHTNLFSLEELAKHYEHSVKDYEKALEYCSRAIVIINVSPDDNELNSRYKARFAHRINRLQKKLQWKHIAP